jgi:hypothetical protein
MRQHYMNISHYSSDAAANSISTHIGFITNVRVLWGVIVVNERSICGASWVLYGD